MFENGVLRRILDLEKKWGEGEEYCIIMNLL
jgi:hypothetical protein